MDVIKIFKSSNVYETLILLGLMFILILYGFADLTTYLGLLFMLIGGIWLAKKEGFNVFRNYIQWPIIVLFLFATISLLYVSNYRKASNELGSLLEIFVPFFITFYIVRKKKKINKFMLFSLLSGSSIIVIYAFYEYFALGLRRVGSLVENANILGVYMVFVLPFIFINLISNPNKKIKLI